MNTVTATNASIETATMSAGALTPQVPLSFLEDGKAGVVLKVRGRDDQHHHLENLGFVEGATVKVVSQINGDLIVEIKGAQVALSKAIAMKIIVAA